MATAIQLRKQKEFLNKNGRAKLNRRTLEQLTALLESTTQIKQRRRIGHRMRDLRQRRPRTQ
jgi:hypothetical protein